MMLSDVCRVHPVSGRRVRPAWLKAAAARFRCRPGRGYIVAAARLQLVRIAQKIPLIFFKLMHVIVLLPLLRAELLKPRLCRNEIAVFTHHYHHHHHSRHIFHRAIGLHILLKYIYPAGKMSYP